MQSVLLLGSGAVGSLYAGMLARSGLDVSVLARSEFETVRNSGIEIRSKWGDFRFRPKATYSSWKELSSPFDLIIDSLKVLPDANIQNVLGDYPKRFPSTFLLIQNGIDIENGVQEAYPNCGILSSLAFVCVVRTSPGVVYHPDQGDLVLGTYSDQGGISAESVAETFQNAGVPSILEEPIRRARWKKLMWNASFNPLSVVTGGASTQELVANQHTQSLIRSIMREVSSLAQAEGFDLGEPEIDSFVETTRKMTPYKTSMLVDYESGRLMEIEAILGNAIRIAKRLGIGVPRLESIYELLSFYDQKNQ